MCVKEFCQHRTLVCLFCQTLSDWNLPCPRLNDSFVRSKHTIYWPTQSRLHLITEIKRLRFHNLHNIFPTYRLLTSVSRRPTLIERCPRPSATASVSANMNARLSFRYASAEVQPSRAKRWRYCSARSWHGPRSDFRVVPPRQSFIDNFSQQQIPNVKLFWELTKLSAI